MLVRGRERLAREMAERLGRAVSPSLIGYWKQQGAPINGSNAADADALEAWYRGEWSARKSRGAGPSDGESDADAKAGKYASLTQAYRLKILIQRERKLRLANDLAERRLVPATEAERELIELARTVRRHLERLGDNTADRLVGLADRHAAKAIVDQAIHEVLALLSQGTPGAGAVAGAGDAAGDAHDDSTAGDEPA